VVRISEGVLAELAEPVGRALPLIAARVPPVPAAELGRLRAAADRATAPIRSRAARPGQTGSPVRDARFILINGTGTRTGGTGCSSKSAFGLVCR
jgi:hypothetical protein